MSDSIPKLGRIEDVDLRTVWASEPYSFTPWLAQPDNLAMLADAIGVAGLDHIATEHAVSEFSVDIVARVSGTEDIVAIENQLERSDHTHLGQCLTYAAGTEAKIIVWVVKVFTEGHRAALDWLNRKTTEDIAFFGVEVSAVRIGDSVPAPRFNVVAKPNDWARHVRDRAAASPSSPENIANTAYWDALDLLAQPLGVKHGMAKQARGLNYFHYIGGKKGAAVCAFLGRPQRNIGAYASLYGTRAPELFERLKADQDDIEKAFGMPLEWNITGKQYFAAGVRLKNTDVDDQSDWPRQHQWLAESMARLKAIFEPRLEALGAFDYGDPEL